MGDPLDTDNPIQPLPVTDETPVKMENERGELVDLYVPRKCSATNRIIKATDHASAQISVDGRERRLHEQAHPAGRLPQGCVERQQISGCCWCASKRTRRLMRACVDRYMMALLTSGLSLEVR